MVSGLIVAKSLVIRFSALCGTQSARRRHADEGVSGSPDYWAVRRRISVLMAGTTSCRSPMTA
jgi:hypothetical protein